MKVASFEYTDQPYTLKIFGISLLLFLVIFTTLMGAINPFIALVIGLVISCAYFLFRKNKIKGKGTAAIDSSYVNFNLGGKEVRLIYDSVKSYQIENFNGCSLTLRLNDGSKFRLVANETFSNPEYLEIVLKELDTAIQSYKATNKINLVKTPSILERKWMLPFLIVLSLALIVGSVLSLLNGKSLSTAFFSSVVPVSILWAGYLSHRSRK